MKNKVLSKKEQIEIIIDNIRKYDDFVSKVTDFLDCGTEKFDYLYDIGYQIIPTILGISPYDFEHNEILNDYIYDVMNNNISKESFFKAINDYLKEED